MATTIEASCIDDEQKDYFKKYFRIGLLFFSQKLNCRVYIFVECYMN